MRLIDAEKAKIFVKDICICNNFSHDVRNSVVDIIDDVPTIDPVKHGHWVKYDPKKNQWEWLALCSECGNHVDEYDLINNEFPKFCANCGCRMNEEVSE